METVRMPDATILLQYQARQLGWQGLTGITLLLACLAFSLGAAVPEAQRLAQLTIEVEKMREEIPQRNDTWIDRSPQASLNTFYEFLPEEKKATAQLGVLLYMASANALSPDKATYKLNHHKSASFSRYQINLPVRGSYIKIRTFINQALNTLPALALNEISLVRQDINTDEVEANLRFTLFLRRGDQS
ncbi:MAG: hypothetical protein Q8J65_05420 [Nitrosomonadales bacterium]|nr:hypothetical protein [Nitrosomonadales bacterium]